MPLYEYKCPICDTISESLQKSDIDVILCPKCQQSEAKRIISASSFVLKGTGWYETDFKNK